MSYRRSHPKQIGIRLTRRDIEKLDKLCAAEEATVSEVIRVLIRQAPLPQFTPLRELTTRGLRQA